MQGPKGFERILVPVIDDLDLPKLLCLVDERPVALSEVRFDLGYVRTEIDVNIVTGLASKARPSK